MKKILTLLPLICCSLYVLGQGLGTISGSVTDKNLLTAIPGATVSLEGTPLSAITDTLGRFRITGVPPKTYTLKISVVSYTTAVFYNLVLTSGNETNLSVQMEPKSQTLEEVLVKVEVIKDHMFWRKFFLPKNLKDHQFGFLLVFITTLTNWTG